MSKECFETAWQPYMKKQITQQAALDRALIPMREFMIRHTDEHEIGLFVKMSGIECTDVFKKTLVKKYTKMATIKS